ncbi:sensor histidine kinase [Cohnella sp. GbtcB17]|uniref:sensor histidine kinase n=1 Tax=Cohnella sp. GbtcB17 TaxID=2824762 RepID=UPI001C307308|nr:sensor histidine kinase [Cohnella sp. GbtcB17]
MNIRTKLFWTNGAVVVILTASLTYFLENYARSSMLDILQESAGHSLSQLAENVDSTLRSYEQVADYLYMDDLLQERLLKTFDAYPEAHEEYFEFVKPQLYSISSSTEILDIAIYTDNASFHVGSIRPLEELAPQLQAHPCIRGGAVGTESLRTWSASGDRPGRLILTQRMNHLNPRSCLFFQIENDANKVADLIKMEGERSRFLVLLPDGSSVMDSVDSSAESKEELLDSIRSAEGGRVVDLEGEAYLLNSQRLSSRNSVEGLQVASLLPLEELEAKTGVIRQMALLFFLFTLAAFVVVNYIVSNRITRRLRQLSSKMRRTDMDSLQPIGHVRGNDEVSHLGHMFNDMVLRMQRLLGEVYESELREKELQLRTKEAELYALQTQINPHYLYNTLNSIRGNLLENGDRPNAEIVGLLAKSFRQMLGKSGGMIPLEEELGIVETYLRIQAFRYPDRLKYRIEVEENLLRLRVPKLSLQILVENSIVHGLEPKESPTTIVVSAEKEEEAILLRVEDDGIGLEPARAAQILARLSGSAVDGDHIGLLNVHQRLQSLGSEFGIRLTGKPGEGTTTTMRIPCTT